jgi:hypothetical protein
MTPEAIIANLTALVQAVMVPLGGLCGVAGTVLFASGKATDSPNIIRWGKNSWLAAIIAFGGAAVVSLAQYLSGRIFA